MLWLLAVIKSQIWRGSPVSLSSLHFLFNPLTSAGGCCCVRRWLSWRQCDVDGCRISVGWLWWRQMRYDKRRSPSLLLACTTSEEDLGSRSLGQSGKPIVFVQTRCAFKMGLMINLQEHSAQMPALKAISGWWLMDFTVTHEQMKGNEGDTVSLRKKRTVRWWKEMKMCAAIISHISGNKARLRVIIRSPVSRQQKARKISSSGCSDHHSSLVQELNAPQAPGYK